MARFYLEFDEPDAYAYQVTLTEQLIHAQQQVLKSLQQEEVDAGAMQTFMDGQSDLWEPMQKFLRMPDLDAFPDRIEFQKLVIQFLEEKKSALQLMAMGQKRPETWAIQHFNEMQISDKLRRLNPEKAQKVLEAIYDRLRMFQQNFSSKIFLVSVSLKF